jgi:hypothetical protein
MEALCGFSKMKENDDLIGDLVGQLRESGKYWMGKKRSGLI